ncbi:hypothetical protein HRF68_20245 [Pseudomonas stutzeri]|nr:hypothetical protein [Stutzerimonas stutzeri]
MAGEVANIAEVAVRVTKDIFKWFKWEAVPLMDENFPCHKVGLHKKEKKGEGKVTDKSHTHPVDVVFKYFDPYLNKNVLLNTDLKSYAKSSISTKRVADALESLAKTIDCARSSTDWQDKYVLDHLPFEVRGMLFVYNHDDNYDKDFIELIKPINLSKIGIQEGQFLHVLDPLRIRYLFGVVSDMKSLIADSEFPKNDYSFFYPDLYLTRSHGDPDILPATVELICSPYMIIRHGAVEVDGDLEAGQRDGYVIYYNQSGETEQEFRYLLDSLSRFQILRGKCSIKIRVAHHSPSNKIMSNFQSAKNMYLLAWGSDSYKKIELERIEFDVINMAYPKYMPGVLAWRYQ